MKDSLGFEGSRVGTHSIRYGLDMALYLVRRPITAIMLIDRCCREAFLLYIRSQVQEISTGFSEDMTRNEFFFTIPDLYILSDRNDHRTRNTKYFANMISLNGPSAAT